MIIVLDADGLIKLNRASVLARVLEAFDCIIPQAVYREAVTEGKSRMYPDAEAIETTISDHVRAPLEGHVPLEAEVEEPALRLGAGEREILGLLPRLPDAVVVSDDRRFLTVLSVDEVSFLTPADLLIVLVRRGVLTNSEAMDALDRIRPLIRVQAYWAVREEITALEGSDHE